MTKRQKEHDQVPALGTASNIFDIVKKIERFNFSNYVGKFIAIIHYTEPIKNYYTFNAVRSYETYHDIAVDDNNECIYVGYVDRTGTLIYKK